MKNIFLVIMTLLGVIIGCKSDDNSIQFPDPIYTGNIFGLWKLEKSVRDSDNHNQNLDYCELQNTLEFRENGKAINQTHYLGTDGSCHQADSSIYNYFLESNILKLVNELNNDVFEEEILELSEVKLVIRVNHRYSGPLSHETYTVTYKRVE